MGGETPDGITGRRRQAIGRRRAATTAGALLGVWTLAAGLVASSCDASVAGPPGASMESSTSTTAPKPTRTSPGCGRVPTPGPTARLAQTGDVSQDLSVGHTTRTYRLAVPANYDPNRPTPLILLFHGWGSDALQISIYSALPRRGAEAGYLVATPDAIKGAWSLAPPASHSADLRLVSALISALAERYCVDLRRIYAAGFSLGSEFSAIAACTYPRRIAAIGLGSAEFLLEPCPRTVPVVAFHGTADRSVAYFPGGVGASLPGIHVPGVVNNLTAWAKLDGCNLRPAIRRLSSQILRRIWGRCRGDNSVVLYTVLGGGHTWPGSPIDLPSLGMRTTQLSATDTILAFFSHHELPAATAAAAG